MINTSDSEARGYFMGDGNSGFQYGSHQYNGNFLHATGGNQGGFGYPYYEGNIYYMFEFINENDDTWNDHVTGQLKTTVLDVSQVTLNTSQPHYSVYADKKLPIMSSGYFKTHQTDKAAWVKGDKWWTDFWHSPFYWTVEGDTDGTDGA